MKLRALRVASIAVLLVGGTLRGNAAKSPTFTVSGPTVIAFYGTNNKSSIADDNEALYDFQYNSKEMETSLRISHINFRVVYGQSFTIRIGVKITKFRVKNDAGYYLVAPGKVPRIEHGVMTDSDLSEIATEYFGSTPAQTSETDKAPTR